MNFHPTRDQSPPCSIKMAIPKGPSGPADDSVTSFVTLPAEIRNLIYEHLFVREKPVLLHNVDVFYAKKPDLYVARNPRPTVFDSDIFEWDEPDALYYADLYDCNKLNARERNAVAAFAEDFAHPFANILGLLRSCRQVHHEAVGVLYEQNTFTFTRASSRHDRGYPDGVDSGDFYDTFNDSLNRRPYTRRTKDDYFHDFKAYHQINYASQWPAAIGCQGGVVRKIIIELGSVCYDGCNYSQKTFDILPLLRVIWSNAQPTCQVRFGCVGRRLDWTLHARLFSTCQEQEHLTEHERSVKDWNNIMHAFGEEDILQLKRFRSGRLLRSVEVTRSNSTGKVQYHDQTLRNFEILDNGTMLAWSPREAKLAALNSLSNHLQDRILLFASSSADNVTLDLDSHTAYGLDVQLLSAQRLFQLERIEGDKDTLRSIDPHTTQLTDDQR
jgi:hypothetical protein